MIIMHGLVQAMKKDLCLLTDIGAHIFLYQWLNKEKRLMSWEVYNLTICFGDIFWNFLVYPNMYSNQKKNVFIW